jgi:hypothetical protein
MMTKLFNLRNILTIILICGIVITTVHGCTEAATAKEQQQEFTIETSNEHSTEMQQNPMGDEYEAFTEFDSKQTAEGFSIVLPAIAKHTKERNHPSGDDWNEHFFGKSVGISYKGESDFGVTLVYVDANSLRNKAIYGTVDYMPTVYQSGKFELNLGGSAGFATGYPKKSEGRSKSDPVPWASVNAETCYSNHCVGVGFVPAFQVSPTFIGVYKFRF